MIELLRQGPDRVASRGPRCPDDDFLAAFADGELPEAESAIVRAHLADCDHCLRAISCLAEIADAGDLQEAELGPKALPYRGRPARTPTSGSPGWHWAVAAVLVAAVSLPLWWRSSDELELPATPDPTEERFQGVTSAAPRLLMPESGTAVGSRGARFRWTAIPGAISYGVRIVSFDGDVLYEQTVFNTETILPANAYLTPGETYFVHISARLSSGKSLEAEHVRFIVEATP